MARKILAQKQFTNVDQAEELLSVNQDAVVSSINLTNIFDTDAFVNVYLVPQGETLGSKHTVFNKVEVNGLETFVALQGLTMSIGDKIFMEAGLKSSDSLTLPNSVSLRAVITKISDTELGVLAVNADNELTKTVVSPDNLTTITESKVIDTVKNKVFSGCKFTNIVAYANSNDELKLESMNNSFFLNEGTAVETIAEVELSQAGDNWAAVRLTKTRFFMWFRNTAAANDIYCTIGDIQVDGTCTFSAIQLVRANDWRDNEMHLERLSDTEVLMQYSLNDLTAELWCRVCQLSGSVVGFGAEFQGWYRGGTQYTGKAIPVQQGTHVLSFTASTANSGGVTSAPKDYWTQYRLLTRTGLSLALLSQGDVSTDGNSRYDYGLKVGKMIEGPSDVQTDGVFLYCYGDWVSIGTASSGWNGQHFPRYRTFNIDSLQVMTFGNIQSWNFNGNGDIKARIAVGPIGRNAVGMLIPRDTNTNTELVYIKRGETVGVSGGIIPNVTWPALQRIDDTTSIISDDNSNRLYLVNIDPDTNDVLSIIEVLGIATNYATNEGPVITFDPDGENALMHREADGAVKLFSYVLVAKEISNTNVISSVFVAVQDETTQLYTTAVYADQTNGEIKLRLYSNKQGVFLNTEQIVGSFITSDVRATSLDDTRLLITFIDQADASLKGVVATFDGLDTYTFGTVETLSTSNVDFSIDYNDTDSCVVASRKSNNDVYLNEITFAADVITVGTEQKVLDDCENELDISVNVPNLVTLTVQKIDNSISQKFRYSGGTFTTDSAQVFETMTGESLANESFGQTTITGSSGNSVALGKSNLDASIKVNANIFGDEN